MLIEGVWAEIKVGGEHLRLFAEHNAQGVQASVYNVKAKSWIARSEAVGDIEQGKEKAAEYANAYLRKAICRELMFGLPLVSLSRHARSGPPQVFSELSGVGSPKRFQRYDPKRMVFVRCSRLQPSLLVVKQSCSGSIPR
jgi:hypothetical protein